MARFTFVVVVFIWLAVACAFWDGWSVAYVRVRFRRWRRERRELARVRELDARRINQCRRDLSQRSSSVSHLSKGAR